MSNLTNQGNANTQKQPITIKFTDIHSVKLGEEVIFKEESSSVKKTPVYIHEIAQVTTPKLTLDYLQLVQSVNDHTRVTLGFYNLTPELRDKYLNLAMDKTPILIQYVDPKDLLKTKENDNPEASENDNSKASNNDELKPKILFQGVVTKINAKLKGALYYLEITANSWTIELDLKKKTRSYSKPNLKYTELFKQIESEYPKAVISDIITESTQLGGLILQYQETDWQFLKRIAANFGAGLAVNFLSEKPNLSVGVSKDAGITKIKVDKSNVLKCIAKQAYDYDYTYEDDTKLHYKLTTQQYLNIGYPVEIIDPQQTPQLRQTKQNQQSQQSQQQEQPGLVLYVFRSVGTMKRGEDLIWEHTLIPEQGLTKKWYPNRRIAGISLEGVVLDRINDKALVRLEIDLKHGGAAKDQYNPIRPYSEETYLREFWYYQCATPYTAEGNTGWYCMPEIGDSVEIHFPTEYPTEAFISQSVRKQSKKGPYLKVNDYNTKIFRTKFGKEIRFDPNELTITIQKYVPRQNNQAERVESPELIVLKLNDKNGVTLTTDLPVNINTKNDLAIASNEGSVNITAGSELNVNCNGSSIAMKDGNTFLKGKKVKTN